MTIEEIKNVIRENPYYKATQIGEALGKNAQAVYDRLFAEGTSLKKVKTELGMSSGQKAALTKKLNELTEQYNTAKSAGIKAGIKRKINALIGGKVKKVVKKEGRKKKVHYTKEMTQKEVEKNFTYFSNYHEGLLQKINQLPKKYQKIFA